jgi:spore coat protein CotH
MPAPFGGLVMVRHRLSVAAVAMVVTLCAACTGSGANPGPRAPTSAATGTQTLSSAPTSQGGLPDVVPSPAPAEPDPGPDELGAFDPSVVHDISVTYDEDDFASIVETYRDSGEKEWMTVDVTIDGQTFTQAGMRLKGNSTLGGLRGDGGGRAGPLTGANADTPQELPWLIRLNEYVDGQTYQGYEDFVVRGNNSQTSMNEAVALAMLDEAGLPSQRAAAVRFSVNGGPPRLRLVIEHPDDDAWYESWFDEAPGALYKGESEGDWTYRGDDPAAYDEIFDQEGGSDIADLTPLIDFLRFVAEASDADFAAQLPQRLDVDSFTTYLAMMDLLGNFDDIDGPGNNAYVWWDADSGQLTVVPWDMNLVLGTGFRQRGGGPNPGNGGGGPGNGGAGPPRFGGGENPLVKRFRAVPEFDAAVESRLATLRADLVDSGVTDGIIVSWAQVLRDQAGDLVDAQTVDMEADTIREFLDR